jgi:hypothetical protein
MKHTILILLFLFLTVPAFCQPFVDLINLRYQRLPGVAYIGDEQKKMRIDQFTANMNLPIELKNKDVFIAGASFDNLKFTSDRTFISDRTYILEQKDLYAANLQLGFLRHGKTGKWKTLFIALPKISSDRFSFTKDALQMGGLLLFTKKSYETFAFKFGLYYNREFFGNFFMPLAGLEWKVNKRLNIFGILPGSMNLEYKFNKKVYGGFSYQCITASYRVHQNSEKYFVRNGDRFWGHNQLKAYANYYLTKNIILFMEAGLAIQRKFQLYNTNNEAINDAYIHTTHNGFLFNGGLAFRVRLDSETK